MGGIRAPVILKGDCAGAQTDLPQGSLGCVAKRAEKGSGKHRGILGQAPTRTPAPTYDQGNLGHTLRMGWGPIE